MNFSEFNINILTFSNSYCENVLLNSLSNFEYINNIQKIINLANSDDPKVYLDSIASINSGIKRAFKDADLPACNTLFLTSDYENDYKNSIQTYDNLYSKLLLKTEYLYIQKQLERQIYNFKHEPADLYNQRFNSITENNLKEITKSLKGRDIYSLNDENKLQKISSLKALQELLYHSHIKELNSIVILKDKRDSREPSVVIDDEVRFKMLHLIKPFEQKIKNVVSLNNQSCHK